jgi:hypothetical protein
MFNGRGCAFGAAYAADWKEVTMTHAHLRDVILIEAAPLFARLEEVR